MESHAVSTRTDLYHPSRRPVKPRQNACRLCPSRISRNFHPIPPSRPVQLDTSPIRVQNVLVNALRHQRRRSQRLIMVQCVETGHTILIGFLAVSTLGSFSQEGVLCGADGGQIGHDGTLCCCPSGECMLGSTESCAGSSVSLRHDEIRYSIFH